MAYMALHYMYNERSLSKDHLKTGISFCLDTNSVIAPIYIDLT